MIIANVPGFALPKAWFNFRHVSRTWKRDTEFIFSKYHLNKLTIEIPKNDEKYCKLGYAGLTGNQNQLAVFQIVHEIPEWVSQEAPRSPLKQAELITSPLDILDFDSVNWYVHMPDVTSGSPQLAGLEIDGDPGGKKLRLPWIPLMNALLGEEYIWRRRLEALTEVQMRIKCPFYSPELRNDTACVAFFNSRRTLAYSMVSRCYDLTLREVQKVQDLHRRYIGLHTLDALKGFKLKLAEAVADMCWESRGDISAKWIRSQYAQDFIRCI